MPMTLDELGLTQDQLQEMVVDRIADKCLLSMCPDEGEVSSTLRRELDATIKATVDTTIQAFGEKHVLPNVTAYVESLTLQATNEWGEKRGEPLTFVEYLVSRAEAYMQEKVSHNGKSKSEDSYGWSGTQTRITHLIHQHLHFHISTAIQKAVGDVNSQLAKGLAETVQIKLAEIGKSLQITVQPGR